MLDPIPALPPKLLELGRWVGSYYVAPPGEVFRAMLPPQIDLRHEREFLLTDAGRARRAELDAAGNRSEEEIAELALLSLMRNRRPAGPRGPLAQTAGRRSRRGAPAAAHASSKRARSRCTGTRACRKSSRGMRPQNSPRSTHVPLARKKKRAFFTCSPRSAGRCRCPRSRNSRRFRGRSIERLIRQEKLKSWEEPLAVEEDLFEVDYTPPSNILNADQERELGEIRALARCGRFQSRPALRRHRQRQDGSVSGRRRSGAARGTRRR